MYVFVYVEGQLIVMLCQPTYVRIVSRMSPVHILNNDLSVPHDSMDNHSIIIEETVNWSYLEKGDTVSLSLFHSPGSAHLSQ